MGMGMVVVTESSVHSGRNVTGNGGRGGQREWGRQRSTESENVYVGRGCVRLPEVL